MRRGHFSAAAAGFVLALLAAPGAHAFCRTTTCDPSKASDNCVLDAKACVITGKQLAWRSSCVTIGVQQMGSPRNGLSFDDIAPVVEQAFSTWMHADCGNATPSIDVQLLGPIECGLSEYNSNVGNANIVVFREDEWPYVGAANAIGLTTTRFDTKTGDLWDADIELNGVGAQLSIGDPITGDDLLSVLTHEAGHFLGLSHSNDAKATMRPVYDPTRDGADFRSLAQDDIDGICAVYPPERQAPTASCDNRHGFSAQCGADQPAPERIEGLQPEHPSRYCQHERQQPRQLRELVRPAGGRRGGASCATSALALRDVGPSCSLSLVMLSRRHFWFGYWPARDAATGSSL